MRRAHVCSQVGEIIGRFERKGYKLVAMKVAKPSK